MRTKEKEKFEGGVGCKSIVLMYRKYDRTKQNSIYLKNEISIIQSSIDWKFIIEIHYYRKFHYEMILKIINHMRLIQIKGQNKLSACAFRSSHDGFKLYFPFPLTYNIHTNQNGRVQILLLLSLSLSLFPHSLSPIEK